MTNISRNASTLAWIAVVALAISTLLMWLPALHTPFWGDDYVFLLHAHASNISTAPWWSDFWPSSPVRFWRPLSQGGYWRLMEAVFGGSALAMHMANLTLHGLASISVGVLALNVARVCQWPEARLKATLAGVIYATLAMHFLPVHWAAAANNSMLTVFVALSLSAWLGTWRTHGLRRHGLFAVIPVLLSLALLTKESAVLIPLLMVTLCLFTGRWRWSLGHIVVLLVCALVIGLWLVLDARFTARTDAAYTLELGTNVIRNAAAFVAWVFNVPREALRMALTGRAWTALGWMAATAIPVLLAWALIVPRNRVMLSWRQWLAVAAFAILAYGPYFLFSWNSYAYYAAISALLPVIVFAHLSASTRRIGVVVLLIAVSSWVAVAGTRRARQPALIARAHWGENLLRQLQKQPITAPLWVQVHDAHRFYAVGQAGLAWRLGLPLADIHLSRQCPAHARHCLVIQADGNWHWRHAPGADTAREKR